MHQKYLTLDTFNFFQAANVKKDEEIEGMARKERNKPSAESWNS